MDELTKTLTETKQKIVDVLNQSGLHPMILQMMINDIQHQLNDAVISLQQAKGEKEDGV